MATGPCLSEECFNCGPPGCSVPGAPTGILEGLPCLLQGTFLTHQGFNTCLWGLLFTRAPPGKPEPDLLTKALRSPKLRHLCPAHLNHALRRSLHCQLAWDLYIYVF